MANELINREGDNKTQNTAAENTDSNQLKDKGDLGKKGSMQEAFQSEEGYFTMDEDEKKEDDEEK